MMEEVQSDNPESSGAFDSAVKSKTDRAVCTLGHGDVLEGTLIYEGKLRVEGRVQGELHVNGDIEVARGAKVDASMEASNIAVQGDVRGPVNARNKLNLSGSGTITGDVQVAKLQVSDGATLNGNVRMGAG
jgi:cytoskeletal protein CcmA (bactofilin family)